VARKQDVNTNSDAQAWAGVCSAADRDSCRDRGAERLPQVAGFHRPTLAPRVAVPAFSHGRLRIGRGIGWFVVRNVPCQLADDKFLKDIDGGRFANPD
jgi:hypothetical protein